MLPPADGGLRAIMSLRFRLNLVIASSMLLIVGVGTVFTILNARQSVLEEIDSSMNLALRSVAAGLSDPAGRENPIAYWRSRIGGAAKSRHLQIRIIPADGEPVDLAETYRSSSAEAAPAWFDWWIRPQPRTRSQVVETGEAPIRIVVRDDPNDEIVEAWREARALFGLIFLQALLVGTLVHITLGRGLRSVPVILKGLESIESGNFRERLPDFDIPEFSRIAAAFNHAASALEKARAENRALASRTLTLQEEERRTLAQELHDELGQSLTAVKVTAASVMKAHPEIRAGLEPILSICDHLFLVLRSMMRRLRPTMLDELGLGAALEDMIGSWRQYNRDTKVRLFLDDSVELCADTAKIHLFRIVQEALNNITRHAKASTVDVSLQSIAPEEAGAIGDEPDRASTWTRLTISDDGCGFDAGSVPAGFGLLGMRERCESLGGRFLLRTLLGAGVSITVEVPCDAAPEWPIR
jgi:two-component system, NarL family, sensor histidine kinase UhpB